MGPPKKKLWSIKQTKGKTRFKRALRTNHIVRSPNRTKPTRQKEESSKLHPFLPAQPTKREQCFYPYRRSKSSVRLMVKQENKKLHVESLDRLAEVERRAREAPLTSCTICSILRGDHYSHFFYRMVEEVRVELILLRTSKAKREWPCTDHALEAVRSAD